MNWRSFEKELPRNDGSWIIVSITNYPIGYVSYDTTQVDTECKFNLLNFPFTVETGDGELLSWCYIEEPESEFEFVNKNNVEKFITITEAKELLNCSPSSIYHFVHYEDFPKMRKRDLKSFEFSLKEFELWCKKHNYALKRWQYE